ncbi:MAG: NAD-dependent epimerase/dehydratase family protein [Rudaea sp.]
MLRRSKPVFITGATGCIGSALAKRLSGAGQAVRAMVRNPARAGVLQGLPNVETVRADLTQPESLRGCLNGCSAVYHAAAQIARVDRRVHEAVNVSGTRMLIEEAASAGVDRFVHLSTVGVYAFSKAQNIAEEFPWPECNHPYLRTKREAERMVSAAAGRVPVTIARVGDVFGPGQFLWTIKVVRDIKQGKLQPPTTRASGYLNLIYIDNLLDALLLMGTHAAAIGEVFNVVDGTPMLTSEYIRRFFNLANKRPVGMPGWLMRAAVWGPMTADLVRGREPAATPEEVGVLLQKLTISNEKLRTRLGWEPSIDREEAFRRTDQWLRQEGYVT